MKCAGARAASFNNNNNKPNIRSHPNCCNTCSVRIGHNIRDCPTNSNYSNNARIYKETKIITGARY
jgi:hypothetical protein